MMMPFYLFLMHFHTIRLVTGKNAAEEWQRKNQLKEDDVADGENRDAEIDQSENVIPDGQISRRNTSRRRNSQNSSLGEEQKKQRGLSIE